MTHQNAAMMQFGLVFLLLCGTVSAVYRHFQLSCPSGIKNGRPFVWDQHKALVTCNPGYQLRKAGKQSAYIPCDPAKAIWFDSCEDIDECATPRCPGNSYCLNSAGSYACVCRGGYTGPVCSEVFLLNTPAQEGFELRVPGKNLMDIRNWKTWQEIKQICKGSLPSARRWPQVKQLAQRIQDHLRLAGQQYFYMNATWGGKALMSEGYFWSTSQIRPVMCEVRIYSKQFPPSPQCGQGRWWNRKMKQCQGPNGWTTCHPGVNAFTELNGYDNFVPFGNYSDAVRFCRQRNHNTLPTAPYRGCAHRMLYDLRHTHNYVMFSNLAWIYSDQAFSAMYIDITQPRNSLFHGMPKSQPLTIVCLT